MSPTSCRSACSVDGQPRLLAANVGPLLVELQVGQRQARIRSIQEPPAGIAKADDQLANRVAVEARNALGARGSLLPSTSSRKASLASSTGTRISPSGLRLRFGPTSCRTGCSETAGCRWRSCPYVLVFGVGTGNHHRESRFRLAALAKIGLLGPI